jgi:hypothetical protein
MNMDEIEKAQKALDEFRLRHDSRVRIAESEKTELLARLDELKTQWDDSVYADNLKSSTTIEKQMADIRSQMTQLDDKIKVLRTWQQRESAELERLNDNMLHAKTEAYAQLLGLVREARESVTAAKDAYLESIRTLFAALEKINSFCRQHKFNTGAEPPEWRDLELSEDELFRRLGKLPKF